MLVIITFIISRCFTQHQNHCDIEINTEVSNKNHKIDSEIKRVKTTYSQTQISKIHFKNWSRVARTKTLLCDLWFQNKKHDEHWVIFSRYFLVMQNVVSMILMHHTKTIIKTMKCLYVKTIEIYASKSYMYTYNLHINIKTVAWFVIPKELLHQIFAWYKVPKSPTEITKSIKSHLQAVFW